MTLDRRTFLLSGAAALTAMPGVSGTPDCALVSEQEEGPYYVDSAKLRRDVTEGRGGVPLQLRIALVNAKTCAPLENAAIDIWHCDATGVYSGFTAQGSGGRGGRGGPGFPGDRRQIDETRFLRGIQVTGGQGVAEFGTIYPGWYQGRTIHIHLKVHLAGTVGGQTYEGGHVSHTGQLFFPEEITDEVAGMNPYAGNSAVHRTLQSEDGVFQSQHGSSAILRLERLQKGSNAGGFLATAMLAVDPEATPPPVRMRGGGRGPGRRGPGAL